MRTALALFALIATLSFSRAAFADVTITGTVGEIGVLLSNPYQEYVRFKLTDLNQTKTCTTYAGYAFFLGTLINVNNQYQNGTPDPAYREWYAALLVSKKGAPIICTIDTNTNCHVTSCTLP